MDGGQCVKLADRSRGRRARGIQVGIMVAIAGGPFFIVVARRRSLSSI